MNKQMKRYLGPGLEESRAQKLLSQGSFGCPTLLADGGIPGRCSPTRKLSQTSWLKNSYGSFIT